MKLPFFSKFISGNSWTSSLLEMEEVTDKTCREFLRNPKADIDEVVAQIHGESNKVDEVLIKIRQTLPKMCKASLIIKENPQMSDEDLAKKANCCLIYMKALHQLCKDQELTN